MTLNMTLTDLAAILSLAAYLSSADDDATVEEVTAAMSAFSNEFALSDEQKYALAKAGRAMSLLESLDVVNSLGPNEKQFAANVLAEVVIVDGQLTESEKKMYWQFARICELPEIDSQRTTNR